MKRFLLLISILFFLFLLVFISFGSFSLFPPGCKDSGTVPGGCFSTRSVAMLGKLNLSPCLNIRVINCSQPGIEIHNNCDSQITVNGVQRSTLSPYIYLDAKQGLNLFRGSARGFPFVVLLFVSPPLCD